MESGCASPPRGRTITPGDAVPIYQREVERLIDTKTNRGYADAVKTMGRIRDLLSRAGRARGSDASPAVAVVFDLVPKSGDGS